MIGDLTWVELGIPGAEHLVAESGWMLARVQRGERPDRWFWNVTTHRTVIAHGECRDQQAAQTACRGTIIRRYEEMQQT